MIRHLWPARLAAFGAAVLVHSGRTARADAQPSVTYAQQWSIEAEDSELVAPESIAVSKSCQVWIADPRSGLWRFSCDQPQPERVSRSGGGPGEFRALTHITTAADGRHVLLWDRNLQRASLFTEMGKFERLKTLRLPEGEFGHVFGVAPDSKGDIRLVWTNRQPRGDDPRPARSYVYSIAPDGTVGDSLAWMDGFASIRFQAPLGEGTLDSRFDAPLQRRPFVVFLEDGGFVTGTNGGSRLTRYDAEGRAVRSFAVNLPRPGRVTDYDRRAYMDSIRQSGEREMEANRYNDAFRKAFRKAFERNIGRAVKYPDTRQWYDNLILDDTGEFLWIEVPRHDGSDTRTWLELRLADGTTRRRITVPHQGSVVAAAVVGDSLITIESSADAIPRIARYGSTRQGSTPQAR